MDPDANLIELRSLASETLSAIDSDVPLDERLIDRMSSLVIALDEWITNGGHLPAAWVR